MGYIHLPNLYKDQSVLLFREVYVLEKVHGTSAHLKWGTWPGASGALSFFAGGAEHPAFVKLFDQEALSQKFAALGHSDVVVYGEAYGGKMQGMKRVYGEALRFIVFDVRVGTSWLAVPDMVQVAEGLGLEAVPWKKISTELAALDAERDAPSEVAVRRGCGEQLREGIVIRPLIELTKSNGERVIAKHKRDEFKERATPQKIVDPATLQVIADADAVSQEWVTEMRLSHILDKLVGELGELEMAHTPDVVRAMVEDVRREAAGEIVESKEVLRAIGTRAAKLFHARLRKVPA